jgi:hypothetical protein
MLVVDVLDQWLHVEALVELEDSLREHRHLEGTTEVLHRGVVDRRSNHGSSYRQIPLSHLGALDERLPLADDPDLLNPIQYNYQ